MPGSVIKVTVVDKGWDAIKARIGTLKGSGAIVSIGVQGTEAAANHQGTHLTVAQLATIHEFGKVIHQPRMGRTIVIPERSFLRKTVDMYRDAIARRQVLLSQGFILGKFELTGAMELLGMYVVGLIKQRIANGIAPPNSPWTIARKGSSKPLIDTGQLRNSITHKVEIGAPRRGIVEFREGA